MCAKLDQNHVVPNMSPQIGGVSGFHASPRAAAALSCHLTNRSSGRVRDKVPSSYIGVRAAQLNR